MRRQSKPFFVRTVQPPVFMLMDYPTPVCHVQIALHNAEEIPYGYGIGRHRLHGLHILLAQPTVL